MKTHFYKTTAAVLAVSMLLSLTACQSAPQEVESQGDSSALVEIEQEAVPKDKIPQVSYVKVPTNPGITVYSNSSASIDASNASEGYVSVKYTGSSSSRIKVQITKNTTYTYDLNNKGNYEVFPLSEGDGSYSVKVFENVSGNKYAQAYSTTFSVTLKNNFTPFLYPNQYVDFNADSKAVKKAAELASPTGDQLETIANVYNFVINNVTYDDAKAATVSSGYLPKVDSVLSSGKGICFDYAALMTAMLRSQGIPTKLVVGYTGDLYHAWINTYIPNVGWVNNMIYFDGTSWKLMDPTFASNGNSSDSIMQFIGNGSNYSTKYVY